MPSESLHTVVVPAADGGADGGTIVAVHGFGQTARCWGPALAELGRHRDVIAVDAPGHGGSATVAGDLWATADLLARVIGDVAPDRRPVTLVGYSMGARMALHVAVANPGLLDALVLVSGTAGIEDDGERAARRAADDRLADELETDGVAPFVERWLAGPLFATLPPDARFEQERRSNDPAALARSLRTAGTGTQEPLWGRLADIACPVLVVAGELDDRFVGLARRLAAGIGPNATLEVVAGAGHSVHLERPDEFVSLVERWLRPLRSRRSG